MTLAAPGVALGRRVDLEDGLAQVCRTCRALAQLPAMEKLWTSLVGLKQNRLKYTIMILD